MGNDPGGNCAENNEDFSQTASIIKVGVFAENFLDSTSNWYKAFK